jgi:predicted transcriptional regulator
MLNYQETSRMAWRDFVKHTDSLDGLILQTLEAAGEEGMTCDKIEEMINRSHQAVSGNLRHLVERGLVIATGQKGLTRSRRSAKKWRIA